MTLPFGQSNIEATESETLASLLDPACDIPPDVQFELEDEIGTKLGVLGGHKALMALKSPVFKAMLFGPLREKQDLITIKNTSVAAFNTLLRHIYEDTKEEEQLKMDIRELFEVADLAERYHLPGLMAKMVNLAKVARFPSEEAVEVFSLAEQFQVYGELSQALKENIADLLVTIIQTPEDLNDHNEEFLGRCGEDKNIGLRMLALIDHRKLVYVDRRADARERSQVISHIRHIDRSLKPREHLEKLKELNWIVDAEEDPYFDPIEVIAEHGNKGNHHFVIESLKHCSRLDALKAAEKGVPLTADTIVEENYTHERSVKLHLEMLCKTIRTILDWEQFLEDMWYVLEMSIPQVQTIIFTWFNQETFNIISRDARMKLRAKMSSCDEAFKDLPGFNALFMRLTDPFDDYNYSHGRGRGGYI